jgi:large subunit ribosomal protein L25
MEVGKLTVKRRHVSGKGVSRKLRAQGMIPGVCYGHGMEQAIPISVDVRTFRGSLDPAKRQNTVIDVSIDDDGQVECTVTVMVKDYQLHKLRRELMHVDLVAIDREAPLIVETPIEYVGKPKALVLGAQLHVLRRTVEVRCRPADIPSKLVVDIADLDVNEVIHVSDMTLPPNVEAHSAGHYALITCVAGEVETATSEEEAAS